MSATATVRQDTFLPSGERMIAGIATLSTTYLTGGLTLDLSSYLKSTDTPTVVINGDDGYFAVHNRGTASAGKVILYWTGAAALTNTVFSQAATGTDASSVICQFTAIGDPA